MNQRIELNQVQQHKLAMTPQLKQSIHILKLSGHELLEFLKEQSQENPALEVDEQASYYKTGNRSSSASSSWDPLLNVKAPEQTLEEMLMGQLRVMKLLPGVSRVAAYMAGNLNESGYLTITIEEACRALGVSEEAGTAGFQTLLSLDPPGIGARSLQECLLTQIRRDEAAPLRADELVGLHLPLVGQGKLKEIAERMKLPVGRVQAIVAYVKTLDPRPGLAYQRMLQGHYIVPEAIVRKEGNEFVITMTSLCMPKITVNPSYAKWAKDSVGDAGSFLREKVKAASWIMRSVEQRKLTLIRVIRTLVEEQYEFMLLGPGGLKPIGLRTIAERLGLHESTVSRAVQGKYIQTPHGIFELKYFFTVGLQTLDGGITSITNVKHRIKQLVSGENKKQPYSDQQLADLLAREGIAVSRRTIAKYREEIGILSSAFRKSTIG